MRKIWTIARREYGAMVATKAFLLSITLMPILMFGGLLVASRMDKMADVTDKRLMIADGTGGVLFSELERAAVMRNGGLAVLQAAAGADKSVDKNDRIGLSRFLVERNPKDALNDDQRLALSDRVRSGELEAFVEIPANIFEESKSAAATPEVRYYGPNAMFSGERIWIEQVVNDHVKSQRFKQLDLDPAVVKRATATVPVEGRALLKKLSDGRISGGGEGESQNLSGVFLPFAFMMLMFMVIMMSAQPLLESVMEEKTGRIGEVLLGSVNSFQLMLGKLLGNVAGSLSVLAIYAGGSYAAAAYKGWQDHVPWDTLPWFLVYQVLAVLLFSSIYMAVGAAVTQIKEAQSMVMPVMLLMCVPMFVWLQIVREPNGSIATALSMFPPSAPLVMVVRLASEEAVPKWQIAASLAILLAATAAITYLAARIFRVGMLWQGKTPKLTEMIRWAWSG